MAGPAAVWGIDLGRCALKAIRLRPGADGQVDVLAFEYIEHSTMLSQAEGNRHALIMEALEKFLSRNDISKDKIVVAVPGQHTLSRFSKLPPVDAKKIPDIVRYEADQQIPFDLDEVIWDFQTFQEEDSPDIEVGIFAMKRELIHEYLIPFEQAGIEPVAVQSTPLALYNAMRFEQRLDEHASILLDLGAENTDLIVATKHGLWTRTIPLGGNKFTDALVKGFKLSFPKAENLKRTAASSKYARQVFQAMRPVFSELVQELSRSLGFYRSTHREADLKRIVGMGDAFALPGLQKYLQQNLQMPVERPTTFKMANLSEARNASELNDQLPSFLVSYGLALQGLDQTKSMAIEGLVKSNLLPPEVVRQVIWRKKKPFFVASAACLALAAGIVWFRYNADMGALQANAGQSPGMVNVARAEQILKNGIPGSPPKREQASLWLAVAQSFSNETSKYSREGIVEKETAEELIELQRNKSVWPRILQSIHAALPRPQDALCNAKDCMEYMSATSDSKDGPLSREKRRQIFIESLFSQYSDDVSEFDLLDEVEGVPRDTVEDPDTSDKKGFLVTIRCRTPHADQLRFVSDTFKASLRTECRKVGAGFYVDRVVLTKGGLYSTKSGSSSGSGKSGRSPGRGGGRGGRGGGRKSTPPPTTSKPGMIDPVTDESMDEDWVFELQFDVLLHDYPAPEKETES